MATAQFNKIFQPVNECKKRYRVVMGSAGSGKSVNIAQDYIIKLSDPAFAGCSLLCVRGVEVSHLNSTFAELNSAISRLGLSSIWESRLNPMQIRNKLNGNTIIFRGCNDQRTIERLKSVTVENSKLVFAWLEEATELKDSDFSQIDNRLRGELPDGHYYQITLSFNPISSTHWIKSQLWDYDDGNTFCHRSTYLDNPFIDEAYRQRMSRMKVLDPEGYRVYGLGEWGSVDSNVFTNIEISDYSKKEFDQYTIGADWGFVHLSAILLIGWRDSSPYVIKEVAIAGKTTAELIQLCNEANIPRNVPMCCDSAEPDRISEFKKAGYMAFPVKKEKNSIQNQISWLKNRTIHIDGRCINTAKEIQAYRWQKNPSTGEYMDEPVKFNDDCVKALIYGCETVRKARRLQTMSKKVLGI